MKPADNSGEEKPILKTEERGTQPQWTKDGHFLLFLADRSAGNPGLWVLPFPSYAKPVRLLQDRVFSRDARVSPDGHWLAYDSTKSGTSEVYVRAFAPGSASSSAAEWLVSKGGGMRPRWRPDGKELFYLIAGTFGMGAAEINTAGGFNAGTPHRIFTAPSSAQAVGWDISPDGKRLLFAAAPDFAHSTPFTVVLNWAAGLKK